ncbi:unnamed protein product [Heterobilharzia americana]|nr:unnamed protein product [Heterobilharzia americana]
MWESIQYFLGYKLFFLTLINFSKPNDFSRLNLLTPNRPGLKIHPLFSHFTPFDDMLHIQSRRQRLGIIRSYMIENMHHLYIGHRIYGRLDQIMFFYLKLSELLMNKSIPNSEKSINETFIDVLKIVTTYSIDKTYLHFIHVANSTNFTTVLYNFIRNVYNKPIMPKKYIPGKPLHILLMHAWRLYYLLALGSSNIWFHFRPNKKVYEGDLSKIHDEWSVLFIYDLCRTIEKYRNLTNNYNDYYLPNGFVQIYA